MKVLIPVQDAIFGDVITDMITKHSWPSDTEFKLLTVLDYETYGEMLNDIHASEAFHAHYSNKENFARRILGQYAHKLEAAIPGATLSQEVTTGMPKEVILDKAESWGADMIVMGSHSRKGFSRFLLGSVSMSVLSHAPCSVIIVKLPKEQKTTGDTSKTAAAVS